MAYRISPFFMILRLKENGLPHQRATLKAIGL